MNHATRACPYCGEQILSAAKKCKHCGEFLDASTAPAPVVQLHPDWNQGIAAVLSFFIPGAGQIYKGNIVAGLLWFVFTSIGYLAFIIPGLVLHVLCIFAAASGDPYRNAREAVERMQG